MVRTWDSARHQYRPHYSVDRTFQTKIRVSVGIGVSLGINWYAVKEIGGRLIQGAKDKFEELRVLVDSAAVLKPRIAWGNDRYRSAAPKHLARIGIGNRAALAAGGCQHGRARPGYWPATELLDDGDRFRRCDPVGQLREQLQIRSHRLGAAGIGYSLPEADFVFKHMLKTAETASLSSGTKQVRVVVKDSDGAVEDRYRRFFGQRLVDFQKDGVEAWIAALAL